MQATNRHHSQSPPHIPAAQLWVGSPSTVADQVLDYLQRILCPHHGCHVCHTCHALRNQQYYATTWLMPEKQYTLESLEHIGKIMAFAVDKGTCHFFIIQKADALTPTCANSLLKSMEEPSPGYHFILLTERPQDLLPTIRSRCVENRLENNHDSDHHHPLFTFFSTMQPTSPLAFLKELEQSKIHERESLELLDRIFKHWVAVQHQAHHSKNASDIKYAQQAIALVKKAILMPPMPGSSALLWKDLFLSFNGIHTPG